MRWAILAAGLAALGSANAVQAYAAAPQGAALQDAAVGEERAPSELMRRTAPPNALDNRTYESTEAALLAGDLDYLVREGRRAIARGESNSLWSTVVFADELAAGRNAEARVVLQTAQGGLTGGVADMLEPFLLAAEGRVDRGVERVDAGQDSLPAPLPEVQRALVFESAGRLQEAAAIYAQMVDNLDTTPPGEAEPQNAEELTRALNAARTTNAIYRAAVVHHRLGQAEQARRYYRLVQGFAPRAADVAANLTRLDAGQGPLDPALTAQSAAGRWMLFVSEYLTQTETIAAMIMQQEPRTGLSSESGTALLQLGVLLAPDADDWRLYAAQQALDAGGVDGAERIVARITDTSVFAADAEIVRANIAIERDDDQAAMAAADRANAHAGERWSIIASVGDIYRRLGHADRAIPAFDRALAMVQSNEDRADVYGYRAYAHRFAGNLSAATADMRAAYELDQSVDTRLLYVTILMDDPAAWRDGIAVARNLLAEQPDSVTRLNTLGYALIQRPEGLEEGYRLLVRGVNFNQNDYAVIDSLGWAYYLHGRFDEALALVERANEMSAGEPNSEILDHLGDVLWRLNRRDDARNAWRQAIDARPDALRRRALEQKVARGMTAAAPRRRELPRVTLPQGPSRRDEL
ncbi:MAG: tetratricopeptide repeat protein [Hyphomonadaceae bacterium]|nr:tetratricopeptide repeat protein [Hyphomonadaceae bacterium]